MVSWVRRHRIQREHEQGGGELPLRGMGGFAVTRRTRGILKSTVALALCVPFVYPIYFLLVTALKTSKDYVGNELGFPHPIVLSQFTSAWTSADLGRGMVEPNADGSDQHRRDNRTRGTGG